MGIRVAMVTDFPEIRGKIDGGVQAVTSYLVDEFVKMPEIDLHIVSFKHGIPEISVVREQGFRLYRVPYGRLGTMTGLMQDQKNLNSVLAEIAPDVVHAQGGGHHGVVAARSGYPVVVTIHGILRSEADHLSGIRRRLRTRFQGWMGERYCIRRASNTILISPYVADHYGARLMGRKFLIPNPVSPRFFDVSRNEEPGRILFAGRIYALKGVSNLLQAVTRIESRDGVKIVLAGSLADTEYVDRLKSEASSLGILDAVEFRGILSTDDLLGELSACACLVLPSYQETAPMVIQEAMAAGVPVVASNICGIPYQISDGQTGFLVAPGDVEALASRLDTLLGNSTMRRAFGAAARARADREYRAEAVARATVEVYRSIAALQDAAA